MAKAKVAANGIKQSLIRLRTLLRSWIVAVGRGGKRFLKFLTGETQVEGPKAVLKEGWRQAVSRSLVHILPLLATGVLAALNFVGFFVGSQFTGANDSASQSLYRLLLQVTAKLYELFIVASLTTIIWDVLKGQLLGPDGLPLGLVSAPQRFVDLLYFISPSFWYGHLGIRQWLLRVFVFLFLVTSGAVALFAGPSSALLMLPQEVRHWKAGGATMALTGSNETLWPAVVEKWSDAIPRGQTGAFFNTTSRICIECDTAPIAQSIKGWKCGAQFFDVDIADGYVRRSLSIIRTGLGGGSDTWSITPPSAPCVYSKLLATMWHYNAIFFAPRANGLRPYRNYRYREYAQTTSLVETEVPMVRASCNYEQGVAFASVGEPRNRYRMQPDIGPTSPDWMWVSPTDVLPFLSYYNDPGVTTLWLIPPIDLPDDIDPVSSAYLNIQVADANSSTTGTIVECAIDARWALGAVAGSQVAWWPGADTFNASVKAGDLEYPSSGYEFPSVKGIKWRRIKFRQEWLDTLTPPVNESRPGVTTLSRALVSLGINNTLDVGDDWPSRITFVQALVSALVANGLAQIGYELNGGGEGDLDGLILPQSPKDLDALLDGRLVLPALRNMTAQGDPEDQEGPQTELQWNLLIAGLAYKADSPAYYLALVVVFSSTLLALGHTLWLLFRRRVSTAWETHHDMLALAINSQPTQELESTSGGVKCVKRLQRPVRVKNLVPGPQGQGLRTYNELQLTIGDEDKSIAAWKTIEVEKKYS